MTKMSHQENCGICHAVVCEHVLAKAPAPSPTDAPPAVCTGSGYPANVYLSGLGRGSCGVCGSDVMVDPWGMASTHPHRPAPSPTDEERRYTDVDLARAVIEDRDGELRSTIRGDIAALAMAFRRVRRAAVARAREEGRREGIETAAYWAERWACRCTDCRMERNPDIAARFRALAGKDGG